MNLGGGLAGSRHARLESLRESSLQELTQRRRHLELRRRI